MDGDHVALEVVLPAEGSATGFVIANKRLGSVGVVSLDVSL